MNFPHTLTIGSWAAFLLVSLPASHGAQGNDTARASRPSATISGQVSNVATQSFLEGAAVELAGTGHVVLTDREGRYHVGGIQGELVTLVVSFPGLDTQRIPIPTSSGEKVVRDVKLTSQIYQMEKFTVAGEREGMAKAEVLQRYAPNVQDVVHADTFGDVRDGNYAYMLQHIPGIMGGYNGNEARNVRIRGVADDMTAVLVDGQQLAGASGAATRGFDFDQGALTHIERVEVIKAPTPDMVGASVGGSVNLITKSAFDSAAERSINYSVGLYTEPTFRHRTSSWKQPIRGFGPALNFSYSEVLGEKRNIGVTATLLYNQSQKNNLVFRGAYEQKVDPGPVYMSSMTRQPETKDVARLATGLKLDYKWSEMTTMSLGMSYMWYISGGGGPTFNQATPKTLAILNANGVRTGGGGIDPGYTEDITRVYAVAGSVSTLTSSANDRSGTTWGFNPAVRHRSNGLDIDYSLSYSKSGNYLDNDPQENPKYRSGPKGAVTMNLPNIGWIFDRSKDTTRPTITQTEGPDMFNLNNYSGLQLNQNQQRRYDHVISGKFDLRKDINLPVPTYIKTGLMYSWQSRKLTNKFGRHNYTGPDRIFGTADDNRDLGQFIDPYYQQLADPDFLEYFRYPGGLVPFPTPYGIARHRMDHPEFWKEDVAFDVQNTLLNDRKLTEQITGAYVLGNVRLGKVSLLTGVRVEETRDRAEGPLTFLSPEERARRAAWGNAPVTDDEARRRAIAQYGGRATNDGRYTTVFPGAHLRYEPLAGLIARASWSTGIGRPPFGNLIPLDTINEDSNPKRVTRNNPNLKPQYANSYDLSLAYYFRPQGSVSVGVFRKKITDYIFSDTTGIIEAGPDNGFDGQYAGYALTTQSNRGWGKIQGIELSYQQQLVFLPGWAKGFGVMANVTKLSTEGSFTGTTVVNGNSLGNFLPKSGNFGLGYRGYGWDLKMNAIYRSRYLQTFSANASLQQWVAPTTIWNWRSSYAVSRRISLYFDVENVTSAILYDIYLLYPDRSAIYVTFSPKFAFGVKGRF